VQLFRVFQYFNLVVGYTADDCVIVKNCSTFDGAGFQGLDGRQAVVPNDEIFVFLYCEVVASDPDSQEFCLEDAAVIRELKVSFFKHSVVVLCGDNVARFVSSMSSGSIGVASNCVRVCVLNEIVEVVPVILSVFSWGQYSEVSVKVEHWCGKIPVGTSGDV
jgi:hypothetical protein